MKKSNPIDKFKYNFMKEINSKPFPFQSNKISNIHDMEKKLHKAIQNFEDAKSQLEFKFEEITEFGQMIKLKGKMIFFIAPDKHELIYKYMDYTSTISSDFSKIIKDTVSTLLSVKWKNNK